MSQFKRDMEEKMRDPEYAYEFGRTERELEIIELLESFLDCEACADGDVASDCSPGMAKFLITAIKKKASDTSS